MVKRRRMTAKQRKYFGKRKTRTVYRTKVKRVMARRGRFRGYARRGVSRAGGFKGMLAPIIAGVGDSYLDPLLPIDGVAAVGVGMFMSNSTVKDIGLYKVGMSLGNILPLPGRTGGTGGML